MTNENATVVLDTLILQCKQFAALLEGMREQMKNLEGQHSERLKAVSVELAAAQARTAAVNAETVAASTKLQEARQALIAIQAQVSQITRVHVAEVH